MKAPEVSLVTDNLRKAALDHDCVIQRESLIHPLVRSDLRTAKNDNSVAKLLSTCCANAFRDHWPRSLMTSGKEWNGWSRGGHCSASATWPGGRGRNSVRRCWQSLDLQTRRLQQRQQGLIRWWAQTPFENCLWNVWQRCSWSLFCGKVLASDKSAAPTAAKQNHQVLPLLTQHRVQ